MAGKSLEDYEVLNIIQFGVFGTCFKVCEKGTGSLFIWKAVDYGSLSGTKKQAFLAELKELNVHQHPNIIHCLDYIVHMISDTVYVVLEWCPGGDLASIKQECKTTGEYLNEDFLWKMLYQIAQALYFCKLKSRDGFVMSKSITLSNIFLDADGNAKLGDNELSRILQLQNVGTELSVESSFFNSPSPDSLKNKEEPKSEMVALGFLIYELATLSSAAEIPSCFNQNLDSIEDRLRSLPKMYSEDLHSILKYLFSDYHHQSDIRTILHHPTVVKKIKNCVWNPKDFNWLFQEKCNLNLAAPKSLSQCQEKQLVSLRDFPPTEMKIYSENVSEKTFQEKWLHRIESIRKKEAELKMKEEKLNEKDRLILKKEKQVAILEKLAKEKVKRAEIYLKQCKDFRVKRKVKKVSCARRDYNIDSSFSADPGDTSVLPTTAKVDLGTVPDFRGFQDFRELQDFRPKERHVSFDRPSIKSFPEPKAGWENKENMPNRVFNELMTNQNAHGLPCVPKRTSSLSMPTIQGISAIKPSTFSLKLQPSRLDLNQKSFPPKSTSLKILHKKASCNIHTSL